MIKYKFINIKYKFYINFPLYAQSICCITICVNIAIALLHND